MFRESGNSIYVDVYALDVYLPYDYLDKAYRGISYYSIVGSKVRYFAVGNMRAYKNQKEMESPLTAKTHPLGFPMIIMSEPSETNVKEVQFVNGGPIRRCIVLTYYKDDVFVENVNCIAQAENAMIILSRLEGGKMDHFGPEVSIGVFQDVQSMNKISFRIPSEEEEIFIAERYRNPNKHSQKARFADSTTADDRFVSYNMRQEAMKTTTYQALTHEDINTSLIASINRKNDGIIDDPTIMERVVRGLDMSDLIKERDEREASEENLQPVE